MVDSYSLEVTRESSLYKTLASLVSSVKTPISQVYSANGWVSPVTDEGIFGEESAPR